MAVRLFKDGDSMAIQTDCKDENQFISQLSCLLDELISSGIHDGDWEFQLAFWLPQAVELCCAYRGYKADVDRRVSMIAGDRMWYGGVPHAEHDPESRQRENGVEQPHA